MMLYYVISFYMWALLVELLADDDTCYVDTQTHMHAGLQLMLVLIFAKILWLLYKLWRGRDYNREYEFIYITDHMKDE